MAKVSLHSLLPSGNNWAIDQLYVYLHCSTFHSDQSQFLLQFFLWSISLYINVLCSNHCVIFLSQDSLGKDGNSARLKNVLTLLVILFCVYLRIPGSSSLGFPNNVFGICGKLQTSSDACLCSWRWYHQGKDLQKPLLLQNDDVTNKCQTLSESGAVTHCRTWHQGKLLSFMSMHQNVVKEMWLPVGRFIFPNYSNI